jgi:predicted GIY-YIG superfamily endonuclease
MGYTYLIRLSAPLGTPKHFAQYYVGSTHNLKARMEQHRSGHGAKMLAAAAQRGIEFKIIKWLELPTIREARVLERKLKARKNHRGLLGIDWNTI